MVMVFMISRLRRASALAVLVLGSALLTAACERVPLLAPSGSTITLTSSATALPANGSADLIAQVIEASGTPPHSGTQVTFTTNLGSVQPSYAETDTAGRVFVKYVAGAGSGTATITAISGGVSASGTNAIKIAVGSAAAGRVAVNASPTLIPSLGGSAVISATVFDINATPLSGVPVSFATTTGSLDSVMVITDASGTAATTLRTSSTATVTATVGATSSGTTPPATGGTPSAGSSGPTSGSVTVNIAGTPTLVITTPTTPVAAGVAANYTFATPGLYKIWGQFQSHDGKIITADYVVHVQ